MKLLKPIRIKQNYSSIYLDNSDEVLGSLIDDYSSRDQEVNISLSVEFDFDLRLDVNTSNIVENPELSISSLQLIVDYTRFNQRMYDTGRGDFDSFDTGESSEEVFTKSDFNIELNKDTNIYDFQSITDISIDLKTNTLYL